MEPGHEDREYTPSPPSKPDEVVPQWSPVMKTGNTGACSLEEVVPVLWPQWSPVMKTGNTGPGPAGPVYQVGASMEPGHEDREYPDMLIDAIMRCTEPQWSPVMKTGNTGACSSWYWP